LWDQARYGWLVADRVTPPVSRLVVAVFVTGPVQAGGLGDLVADEGGVRELIDTTLEDAGVVGPTAASRPGSPATVAVSRCPARPTPSRLHVRRPFAPPLRDTSRLHAEWPQISDTRSRS
jgi:hypothetical protein